MTSPASSPANEELLALLGPGGRLAHLVPGYEARPGQLRMAEAVSRCLGRGGVSLIEAGTGTGKTLAYLLPALLQARTRRVVISTATRTLQDQLYSEALPLALELLRPELGPEFPVALMKGLPNYVCRRRAAAARSQLASVDERGAADAGVLARVFDFIDSSDTGLLGDFAELAETDPIWSLVSASSERRVGSGCEFFDSCFVTQMKRRAQQARLLVVNHHLFFADLALRGDHPGRVIPDYDVVIFDEAHLIEDAATPYFGSAVSDARVEHWLRDVRSTCPSGDRASGVLEASVRHALGRVFEGAAEAASRGYPAPSADSEGGASRDVVDARVTEALMQLADTLRQQMSWLADQPALPTELRGAFERRGLGLVSEIESLARSSVNRVAWYEARPGARRLRASPLDLSTILQQRLFEVAHAVVLTSATLASDRAPPQPEVSREEAEPPRSAFRYVRQRLGLDTGRYCVEETALASPFDYQQSSLLYVPDDLPAPNEAGFLDAMSERVRALIEQLPTGAGTFVLTTSVRSMQTVHARLQHELGVRPVLLQGQAPKSALIEAFRARPGAVLVATLSFWQGVDVPGDALRLVVLEKAPFPVPTDPLLSARAKQIEESGGSAFRDLHLPLARWVLKQGFGRLIRSQSDTGVVALLDSRIHRRGYGRSLLRGLPPAPLARRLEEVGRFWVRLTQQVDPTMNSK